jgi:hypothetical protein
MILLHSTEAVLLCSATPHTPRGVVVEQPERSTCSTRAPLRCSRWSNPQWDTSSFPLRTAQFQSVRVNVRETVIYNTATTARLRPRPRRLVSTPDHQRESASSFPRLPATRGHRTAKRNHDLPAVFPAGLIFPCASQPLIQRDRTPHKPLWRNETHCRYHLSKDQKGIYARVSNHVFHSVEAVDTRDATVGATEALAILQSRFPRIEAKKTRGGMPGGGNLAARPIIDPFALFRGPAFKILAAASSEKVGWPVKPAALTQRRCVIGQIALASSRERPGARTHQRPFLSHGEAMLP